MRCFFCHGVENLETCDLCDYTTCSECVAKTVINTDVDPDNDSFSESLTEAWCLRCPEDSPTKWEQLGAPVPFAVAWARTPGTSPEKLKQKCENL